MKTVINVRFYGGAYCASALRSKGEKASSTNNARVAADACAAKVFAPRKHVLEQVTGSTFLASAAEGNT